MSFAKQIQKVLRENIREYGMYIALLAIMAIFTITTKGIFLSPRNISNLINQTGYIAVLAVGMTLVIVIRHIDLSVGFLSGFIGALAAISLVFWHWPVYMAIVFALAIGVAAGCLTAFLITKMNIPAFVATLGGWLVYHGALLLVTMNTGSIVISNKAFNAIGNSFIPDFAKSSFLPGIHKVTLLIGVVAILLFVISELNSRRQKLAYHFEILPTNMFVIKLLLISAFIGVVTWVIASYQGISWTLAIVLVVCTGLPLCHNPDCPRPPDLCRWR